LRKLGEGGMGVVYQVFDRNRGALLALKVLRQDDPGAIFRFKGEFRSLADINHPNLITLYELVSHGDQWFFTMELIDGVDFLSFVRGPAGDVPGQTGDTLAAEPIRSPWSTVPAVDKTPSQPDRVGSSVRRRLAPPADFERLRLAMRQLAEGVYALHGANKLHRDIKPSNVLVTTSGRVVLLDFGLITDLNQSERASNNRLLVGTAVYMSPEQAASQRLSEASDWYSVGVILYEALTGVVPFDGPPLAVVMRKQKEVPRPPRRLAPDTPPDLDQLCMDLLAIEPERRPNGMAVLHRLGSQVAAGQSLRITLRSRADVFIGRDKQLTQLNEAFAQVRAGEAMTVFVHGRSGMGKTALLERFVSTLDDGATAVLSGRCYEREYVPYKGLDELIDSLTGYLLGLPET
ncbi:MAG: serine/threonine-protein kinase, partial [Myxococcota bacterium]